jgi:hypothetical protein
MSAWRHITVFTRVRHRTALWDRWISPHPLDDNCLHKFNRRLCVWNEFVSWARTLREVSPYSFMCSGCQVNRSSPCTTPFDALPLLHRSSSPFQPNFFTTRLLWFPPAELTTACWLAWFMFTARGGVSLLFVLEGDTWGDRGACIASVPWIKNRDF